MKLIYKLIGVFLLAFLVTACSPDKNSTPDKVAEKFITNFYQGNGNEIKEQLYDMGENEIKLIQLMADKAKEFTQQHKGLDKVEINETVFLPDSETLASVQLKLEFKDGFFKKESVPVIKVDNKWFIKLKQNN